MELNDTDYSKHIVFKKNEDWMRVIDHMTTPDLTSLVKDQEGNREKWLVLVDVVWHIWHTSLRILEALNSHPDFQWNIVIVSQANNMPSQIDLSMSWFAEQIHHNLIIEIESMKEDIQDIILEREIKSYQNKHTQNFYKHQKPITKKPLIKKSYTKKQLTKKYKKK